MRYLALSFVLLLAAVSAASEAKLEQAITIPETDDVLQYDDGSAYWVTWGGLYRGTWFDLEDFYPPGLDGYSVDYAEVWFYHLSTYPWDTSDFILEIWNGDDTGPVEKLDEQILEAYHYSPAYAYFTPPCSTGVDFWVIESSELSSGGWPSLLGDGTENPVSHSFFSDDFMLWEPWTIIGSTASDYFIRVSGYPVFLTALERMTWGLVKSSF